MSTIYDCIILHEITFITLRFITLGAVNATECPPGTIRNALGGAELADCYPCPAGYYCDLPGQSQAGGECDPRYYCPDFAKITDPMPSAYPCPPGFFCEANTGTPRACPPGQIWGIKAVQISSDY